MKRWILAVPLCFALLGMLATDARAVPTTVHFTGRVSDGGTPITGAISMTFKLYDAESSGTMLWSESFGAVIANAGLVTVELGATDALDDTIFDGGDVYLEISVNSTTQSPRIRVGSVPYAVMAGTSERLGAYAPGDVQERVSGTCASGSSIRVVNSDGSVECQTDTAGTGDITSIITAGGSGLTGGQASGDVSLSVSGVTSAMITDGTITAADLAANSVTTTAIVNGTITSADLAANSVNSTAIVNGTITSADLAANSVTTTAIVNGTITSTDIATGGVNSTAILDNSVTRTDIAGTEIAMYTFAAGCSAAGGDVGTLTRNSKCGSGTVSTTNCGGCSAGQVCYNSCSGSGYYCSLLLLCLPGSDCGNCSNTLRGYMLAP